MNELKFDNSNSKLNYKIVSYLIMTSTKESTTAPLKMCSGWYIFSTNILKLLIDKRSRTLGLIRQNSFDLKNS